MERAERKCGDTNDVLYYENADGNRVELQTGAVRVSFGSLSIPDDVTQIVKFVKQFFVETGKT